MPVTQSALETLMRTELPPALQVLAPDLAQLLDQVQSGALTPAQARARLAEPVVRQLLGQVLGAAGPAAIAVGDITNSVGVAIGPGATARVTYQGPGYPRPDYLAETAARRAALTQTFISRETVLADLMQPPAAYTLVRAPAGRGKSAVAAQLIQRASAGGWPAPTPRVVYFLTNQARGENTPVFFLQRVNAQLLNLLPQFEGGVPADLEALRSQFSQLWPAVLRTVDPAHPLLLIVDGLDEMAPGPVNIATLLPDLVPAGAGVLITTRPNPDPRDLVETGHPLQLARELTLGDFDAGEIQQLLELGGLPAASAAALAPQVRDLTQGTPLFVRFVAQEVVQAGRMPAYMLKEPPKSVRAYFERQVKLITEGASGALAHEVLGLLAVARAGLRAADLAEILETDSLAVRPVIDQIQRFLIGQDRFELMHLELRGALAAGFSAARLAGFRARLSAWGERYRGQGWPAGTPAYLLEQLARLLESEGALEARHRLVTDAAFRAAQRAGLGDIGQTLADVRAALEHALAQDRLAEVVECLAAYRETQRHGLVAEAIFSAVDAGDWEGVLRRGAVCGTDADWSHVLWAYLA